MRRHIPMDAAANIRAPLSEALSGQGTVAAMPDGGVTALPPLNCFDPEFVLGEIDAVKRAHPGRAQAVLLHNLADGDRARHRGTVSPVRSRSRVRLPGGTRCCRRQAP